MLQLVLFSIISICQGLNVIDNSQISTTEEAQQNTETDLAYENDGNYDDDDEESAHHRLLHHHLHTLDQAHDVEELNEQISILSHQQQQETDRRENLEKIVNFLQVYTFT